MEVSFCLQAPIHYEDAPIGFPALIDMQLKDPLLDKTFNELYQQAKDNLVPSYVIAVVEFESQNSLHNRKFKIYDAVSLYSHLNQTDCYLSLIKNNGNILTITYLALKCFELDEGLLINGLPAKDLCFSKFLLIEDHNEEDIGLAIDAVNYLPKSIEDEKQVSKLQFVSAVYLLEQANLQSQEEGIRWLSCASKRGDEMAKNKIEDILNSRTLLQENPIYSTLSRFTKNL